MYLFQICYQIYQVCLVWTATIINEKKKEKKKKHLDAS